ncbi:MAG: hypothetical protein EHM49_00200 [Deltaproteobacteria bacterium]|nr:MAG: hypothetical protein EHM49_00200 [Deltaproteobacteria bacterium]
MIKENIATGGARLPVQWPALSPVYDTLKREYAPDKGQWDLSGTIFNSIGVQKRRMEAGRSVGILYNTPVTRINYSIMRGEAGGFSIRKYRETGEKIKLKRTKVRPSTYAFWNEFGTRATQYSGGQPPRPLFTPTFFQFTKDHLPELTKAIRASLLEDFKRLSRNLAKTSGIGGVGYAGKLGKGHKRGALPGVKLGGEISTFIYEDKFAEVAGLKMRETGAIKWRRGGPEKK